MGYPLLLSFNIFFRSWATPCHTGRYNIPWWAHPASQLQYIILLSSSASIYLLDHGPAPALQENMIFHSGPPLLLSFNIFSRSWATLCFTGRYNIPQWVAPCSSASIYFPAHGSHPASQENIIFHSGLPPASQFQYIFQVMGHPLSYRKI